MAERYHWKEQRPEPAAWQPTPGKTQRERAEEQDTAAGGRGARHIRLPGGPPVCGSVALRVYPSGRRIYAYLRWSERGKTRERYVGEVERPTREENLADAWRLVHDAGLLDQAREADLSTR
ncbi:hypothetical protein ACFORH_10785 [Amycolatopsis roodepoortensis]|uniref:DUF6788 domain-containing protein n=1 Tax=Amycolatopsis roodepoortensis TaxID=700274 RepID=A0ABR9LBF7_9PSEU|nr:hypothetical protein [Amycolatopsis roodepoortensis]MBE1577662.1 hypothetical protein [Amycolatopsis roodepoortensis]